MHKIKPHPIPGADGKIYTATQISVLAIDNLTNAAVFEVTMQDAEGKQVAFVKINLDDQGYAKWDESSPDYAKGALEICAEALGLELQ